MMMKYTVSAFFILEIRVQTTDYRLQTTTDTTTLHE
jgi:hypothetical protein